MEASENLVRQAFVSTVCGVCRHAPFSWTLINTYMRLQQILNEDFSWDSDWDKDMYMSLKGLANKNNGVWKSKKQRDFLLNRFKKVPHQHTPQQAKEHFGIEMSGNETLVILSGMTRWADYGSRSMVPVRHAFVVDNKGVRQHVKLGNKGNMRDGSSPDPSKNKIEFNRPDNVDTSHLAKSEEEKKKEFKTALGMSEGEYVGEVGKRMDFGTLELVAKKDLGYSHFGYNMAAEKYWNLYKDEQGRFIVHVGKPGPERGEKVRIVATVKDHFVSKKGDKQTKIIRPRFYAVETNEEII